MFSWELIQTYNQESIDTYVLNMTSQQWFDEDFTSRPVWWHYLTIHIPHQIDITDRAFMYVGTSNNNAGPPDPDSRHIRETGVYASRTNMVTAALRQTPNQPSRFNGTIAERSEDGLIAWTWRRFMDTPLEEQDPEILLRFPMCKGVKRAFDAMQEFVNQMTGNQLNTYMVAGESKRGWTTWLQGAVDDRVEAMAPVVLSCLNVNTNMHHYYQSLGNWPFAFGNYWAENITSYMDSDRVFELEKQVDPLSYKDFLTMPKMMVSGASDEFFMPDDYEYFFDDLLGEKFIWLLENTGHSIGSSPLNAEYWRQLETFYLSVINNDPFPEFSWENTIDADGGRIVLTTSETIANITAVYAVTPDMVTPRRDFRMYVLSGTGEGSVHSGIEWFYTPVEDLGNGQYAIEFSNPEADHYLAFYIKVIFPRGEDRTLTFTSEVNIIPDGFPFEDCSGTGSRGQLV
jgi:PhoPQ-activated pathogenicity-related protein